MAKEQPLIQLSPRPPRTDSRPPATLVDNTPTANLKQAQKQVDATK
jgi:hypothetical protein